ncbi:MAG: VanZ family protein [Candidatus Omnitrophota bacterium]|jgi:VanZ family protein|nr:MAG: VanZ family protein [Candidatus Omnitrophota bacterium]
MTRILVRFWLPVLAYMGFIFYLSSRSQFPVDVPEWFYYFDKCVHMVLFGCLGFLFLRAWLQGEYSRISFFAILVTIIFTTLYGISDEFHQSFVPGRTPDAQDVIADAVGAILACVGVAVFYKNKSKSREFILDSMQQK